MLYSKAIKIDSSRVTVDSTARVLILGANNSARSQMAEGLLQHETGESCEVFSAGTEPNQVEAQAITVMNEIGIDISGHRSKSVDEFIGQKFDCVVTVYDPVKELCPLFPGSNRRLHWSFEDPAAVQGLEQERQAAFRRIRDELHERIRAFVWATPNLNPVRNED
jgi:arsenate reductase